MTDPTPTITCFVQTGMPGMDYGDIVTLAHTPYVDALIAGGRLIPEGDPLFSAIIAENSKQPSAWDLLATAVQVPLATPEAPVNPAAPTATAPVDPALVEPAPVEPAPVEPAPVADPVSDPAPAA